MLASGHFVGCHVGKHLLMLISYLGSLIILKKQSNVEIDSLRMIWPGDSQQVVTKVEYDNATEFCAW